MTANKTIGESIKQKKFKDEFQKAHINLIFTASRMNQSSSALLKPLELTIQQFNVLRILKGMHPEPGSVKEVTARMVDKSSNASRLVDKLLAKNWVERKHCPEDRRQVNIRITAAGIAQIKLASKVMAKHSKSTFGKLNDKELNLLNSILDKIRD